MAVRGLEMGLVMVLAIAGLWGPISAQLSCTSTIISMSPCLSYITGNASTPSPTCCSQLASVVSSQPQCLCVVLNGGASSMGVNINQTQALALPGACNVQTPPASRCNAVSPATPPTRTPVSPVAPSTPTVPTVSSPTVPTVSTPTATAPSTPSVSSTPTPTKPSAATPSIPSGTGSKTGPSTSGASSDASSTAMLRLLLLSLLIASYASSALTVF